MSPRYEARPDRRPDLDVGEVDVVAGDTDVVRRGVHARPMLVVVVADVTRRFDGALGGSVSGGGGGGGEPPPILVLMSVWTAPRLAPGCRHGSMRPWLSAERVSADRQGGRDVESLPVRARLATCVPFTHRRMFEPSYGSARCDHAFAGRVAVPFTSPNVIPPTAGGPSRSSPRGRCRSTL